MSLLDRSRPVMIDGEKYDLLLTTNAAAELSEKVGGLENVETAFDTMTEKESFEMMTWLVALLANQGTAARKLLDPSFERLNLTAERVGLLVSPFELIDMKDTIIDAIGAGFSKNVSTENDEKNLTAG